MTEERHSRAFQAALITDEQEKAEAEARNGLRQVDHAMEVIHEALERGAFKLRPSNQLHAVYSRVRGAANHSAPTRTAE